MEVKLKKDILIIKHKLKSSENYKINKTSSYQTVSIFKKPMLIKGVASYCEDGKHVLFIDYDDTAKWMVLEDYKRIQEAFSLPPGYLFCTKEAIENGDEIGNYHIICLKKLLPKEAYSILCQTHADINFMSMPLRNKYKNWILRISNKDKRNKPKFIELIGKNINLDCEISNSHLDVVNKLYKLPLVNYKKMDTYKRIYIQEYETV